MDVKFSRRVGRVIESIDPESMCDSTFSGLCVFVLKDFFPGIGRDSENDPRGVSDFGQGRGKLLRIIDSIGIKYFFSTGFLFFADGFFVAAGFFAAAIIFVNLLFRDSHTAQVHTLRGLWTPSQLLCHSLRYLCRYACYTLDSTFYGGILISGLQLFARFAISAGFSRFLYLFGYSLQHAI